LIYFISDIHLGSLVITDPGQHQQRFVSLLKKMQQDADAIYLLGDVFDFWMEYYWPNKRHFAQFQPVISALKEASTHCPVHFFIGNHDIWTYGWLARETGVIVHYQPEEVVLNGKTCYLAHGDGLGSSDRKFRFLRAYFHNPVPQFFYRLLPPCFGDWFGYHWAASSRRKELRNPEVYKGERNEELINFAREREQTEHADFYIFGHRHIDLSLMLPTRACVYILGDFFRQFTYGVLTPEGIFSVEQDDPEEASLEADRGVSIAFM